MSDCIPRQYLIDLVTAVTENCDPLRRSGNVLDVGVHFSATLLNLRQQEIAFTIWREDRVLLNIQPR